MARSLRVRWLAGAALGLSLAVWAPGAVAPPRPAPGLAPKGPLSPREEMTTFTVPKGFKIELAACEPDVVDPVAMAFDADGRLYVAEMRGYPNDGVGTGTITSGRVRLLQDKDGDGYYETSTVFADGLRFPTGVMPWGKGVLVANAPELLYLEDTKGAGKADRRRTLYSGFDLDNIQQLLNSLQWGMDNWVHACAGGKGGTIRSAEKPAAPAVVLRGRGVRFRPGEPASLEPTSGGGQYGLTADAWGRWFTATNSQHLRHIVLPDHYLRRNPHLAVRAVTLDIPDHGAACRVYRASPFEGWRVERTSRRKGGAEARRFSPTELVPGGYVTSACSPLVYEADLFPPDYRGNVFVCDPANNLIHRDVLAPRGATFTAKRAPGEESCEFLTSTDNWFRPVHLTLGPDGAVYVLDFYRPVIETPLSLPDDIKKSLNLQSRGRGRIWRITTATAKRRKPALSAAKPAELVGHLADGNRWWRITAQRLLVERQDKAAVRPLEGLLRGKSAAGRAHALWALDGLKALKEEHVLRALKDPEAGVREQALALAEARLADTPALGKAAVALADDPSPRVRFQLAFTLGALDSPQGVAALAKVARHKDSDSWTRTAVLSSAGRAAPALLDALAADRAYTKGASADQLQFLSQIASLIGAGGKDADLARALSVLGKGEGAVPAAVLAGLGQGLRNSPRPLAALWEKPPPALKAPVRRALALFDEAAAAAKDAKRPAGKRVAALGLLAHGPFALLEKAAPALLSPAAPPDVQAAAVRALGAQDSPAVGALLLKPWAGYSPAVRREALEALLARKDRVAALLGALEKKQVLASQLEPARLAQLRKHPDAKLRARAVKALAGHAASDRRKVVESYRAALELKADAGRGQKVFAKTCATCHRLEGVGVEVGPDLLAALRNKTAEQLLTDVLDPSREVDGRYLNYLVTTKKGRSLSGMIAAETAASLTLRRGEKAEDTVLRAQVEKVESTGQSLMPEGLEAQVPKQDMADLIAYLLKVGAAK